MQTALFDLDNTLLAGDSDHLWGEYLCTLGVVDADSFRARNDQFYADYQRGQLDINAYHHFCLEPLTQHPANTLHAWRRTFVEEWIRPRILPRGLEQLRQHQSAGDRTLIVTATNDFVTAPIAELIGVDELIATRVAKENGNYTRRIDGTASFQHGKVERYQDWQAQQPAPPSRACFYSDSLNDLPLLEYVDEPVAVDPDERLREIAQKNGWKIISFRGADATE